MSLIDGLISQWLANNNGDDSIGNHDMFFVSPSGYSTDAKLGSHALIYDGIDDSSRVFDHPDFVFGDESSDSPFSAFAWVKMTDATRFRIISKGKATNSTEYLFTTNTSDKLLVAIYDLTNTNKIGRVCNAGLSSDQGIYILIGFTYDGSGDASGIKIYKGNQRVVTTINSAGSYTAMHSTGSDLWIGAMDWSTFEANGLIDVVYIWDRALTDGSVAEGNTVGAGSDIDLLWNGGAGIEISEVVAAGRRRRIMQTRQLRH